MSRPEASGPVPPTAQEPASAPPGAGGRRHSFAPDFLTDLFQNPLEPGYAEAAHRRAEQAKAAGAAGATSRQSGWRFPVYRTARLLVLAAIGFLLIVAYQHVVADEPARARTRDSLIDQINDRQATSDEMRRRADQLRDEVARQRDAALDDRAAARLRDLEATTGLGRVKGDGVVVRLADAPRSVDAVTGQGSGNDLGRVLDRDLQQVANGLWGAGAEAIAINGQRLISTSTIRAAGDAILVDFQPLTGPYEVAAIGPDDMREKFNNSQTARTFRQLAAAVGMSFDVRARGDLSLPAASEPQLRYAHPLPSENPSGTGTPKPTNTPKTTNSKPSTFTPSEGGR